MDIPGFIYYHSIFPVRNILKRIIEILKKIRYNYYYNNWKERRNNIQLLNKARKNKVLNNEKPLISITIPTYNKGQILVNRTIPSVLSQTYNNFEVIIVGDHCVDDTESLIQQIKDERILFHNLPERGNYPATPEDRWRVAGTTPRNKALELAKGEWIAPLDDDDVFSPDHLELLLKFALEGGHEFVYGIIDLEEENGEFYEIGSYPLRCGDISHLAVLYHSSLKFFKYDIDAWKYGEPGRLEFMATNERGGCKLWFFKPNGRNTLL